MKRRSILRALGVLGGISALGLGSLYFLSRKSVGAVPAPEVELEKGWEKVSESTETVYQRSFLNGTVEVVAKQHLIQYEDVALRQKIKDGTLGKVDRSICLLFVSKINFNVPIDDFPVIKEIVVNEVQKNAKERLKKRMRNNGVKNIVQVDSRSINVDTGELANLLVFEGSLDIGEVSFNVKGEPITFMGESLGVRAYLAA